MSGRKITSSGQRDLDQVAGRIHNIDLVYNIDLDHAYITENVALVEASCINLARHISNTKAYGVNVVVAVNMFSTHTEAEINAVRSASLAAGAFDVVLCTHHAHGGKGTVSTMLLLFQA
ncbi:hypothetical protein POM88_034633 [Heracleum sosnowskyi]|uniref:Uncharacterized protein n=1 Tax=Heracleum sosnowskyi TaxID=360622 RepID=A0AAD8HJV4_9APIA|nr:hypothetical protein POM88_034633 [Heracleum sosnowskyi]